MKGMFLNPMTWVVASVFMFVACVGGADLLAQTGAAPGGESAAPVTYTAIVDFSGTIPSLIAGLGPIVGGALGIGLAIFGAGFIYRQIKRFAR